MKIKLLAFVAAAALLSGTALLSSTLSNAESNTVKVCVNKTTKAVFYRSKCKTSESTLTLNRNGNDGLSAYQLWLAAGNNGTEADFLNSLKGPQGIQGPAGSNGATSNWFDVLNCNQKLDKLIWNGNLNISLKKNWLGFESKSGCQIDSLNMNQHYDRADFGLPYISNIKFVSVDPDYSIADAGYFANFEIKILNADAMSGVVYDSPARFCTYYDPSFPWNVGPQHYADVSHISGDRYAIKMRINSESGGIIASGRIMYYLNGECTASYGQHRRPILGDIYNFVDPNNLKNEIWLESWLRRRGWIQ